MLICKKGIHRLSETGCETRYNILAKNHSGRRGVWLRYGGILYRQQVFKFRTESVEYLIK